MLASFTLTKSMMDVLREEELNSLIKNEKDLIEACNKYYVALFNSLYEKWSSEKLSIVNFHSSLT